METEKTNLQQTTQRPIKFKKRGGIKKSLGIDRLCNLCGSRDYSPFLKNSGSIEKEVFFSTTSQSVAGESLVKCSLCGLIYVHPMPAGDFLKKEYSLRKENDYVKDIKGRMISFKNSVKSIKKYRNSGKILDVGCAAGFFLKIAREEGFEVRGVEANRWLVDWGIKNLGVDILSGFFEEADFSCNFFDVVTFWDVLEHLTDPFAALKETNRILKKGGLVVINYPDISSWPARVFGKRWWFVISGHLYYFTPKTISKMLTKAGFKVIKIQPHFQFLSLFYLLTRLGRYNSDLGKKLSNFSQFAGLGRILVPYYAGQTMVIAKKS